MDWTKVLFTDCYTWQLQFMSLQSFAPDPKIVNENCGMVSE